MQEIVTTDPEEMFSWLDKSDLFLTTINTTVQPDGSLVMGAGHARQIRGKFPGIERKFGEAVAQRAHPSIVGEKIRQANLNYHGTIYTVYAEVGLLISPKWPAAKVGGFQTKRCFWESMRDPTQHTHMWLIHHLSYSTNWLVRFCQKFPNARVDMPFPSIGNAGLPIDEVRQIIVALPDNVFVWRLGK